MTRWLVSSSAVALAFTLWLPLQPAAAQSAASVYTTGYRYDTGRRLVGEIRPDPDGAGPLRFAATRYTYDQYGNRIRTEVGELAEWQSEAVAPVSWGGFTVVRTINTAFDGLGRRISESVVSGTTTHSVLQFSYDTRNRLDCVAVRMNPTAFGSLPGWACTPGAASLTYGQDRITRFSYTPHGSITRIQRAFGTLEQHDYARTAMTKTRTASWRSTATAIPRR